MTSRSETLASRVDCALRRAPASRCPSLPAMSLSKCAATDLLARVPRAARRSPSSASSSSSIWRASTISTTAAMSGAPTSSTATRLQPRRESHSRESSSEPRAGALRGRLSAAVGDAQLAPAPALLHVRMASRRSSIPSSTSGRPPTGTSAKRSTCTASCSRVIRICAASSPTTASSVIRSARTSR